MINNEYLNFKFKYCKYENHCAEYELQSWFIFILLKENCSTKFTLAGITWKIESVDREKYKIYVIKAKEAGLATWLGGGRIISF